MNFDTVLYNSTPQKFANIWRIKGDGMSVIKFTIASIHYLRDVFVASAVVGS